MSVSVGVGVMWFVQTFDARRIVCDLCLCLCQNKSLKRKKEVNPLPPFLCAALRKYLIVNILRMMVTI